MEDSLRALGVDYIDLMLIHEPYPEAPAMYRALEEAYDAGRIRAIGVSNFDQAALERLLACCRVTPAVDQIESHVYHPRLELQKWLAARGIRMQSWAPFTEGRRDIFAQPEAGAGRRGPPQDGCPGGPAVSGAERDRGDPQDGAPAADGGKTLPSSTLPSPNRKWNGSAPWMAGSPLFGWY